MRETVRYGLKGWSLLVAMITMAVLMLPVSGQEGASGKPYAQAVTAYAAALAGWEAQAALDPDARYGLEGVLAVGRKAAVALVPVLETLDDAEFGRVRQAMAGFIVTRDEVLVVMPDARFFLEKAKQAGKPADIAFFAAMAETLDGYWPVTWERLTDMTGCTRYGSFELVRLYGVWHRFVETYPDAYREMVRDPAMLLLADIEDQLVDGVSACDGPETVHDEFQAFLKTYPDAPIAAAVRARLNGLNTGDTGMLFYQGAQYGHR